MENLLNKLAALRVQYDWDTLFEEEPDTSTPEASPKFKQGRKPTVEKREPQTTKLTHKQFTKQREELTQKYYQEFNKYAFRSQLPSDLEVTWSKRMTKTAGFTRMKTKYLSDTPRVATIELSVKVIDNEERLRATLLHEMCHVAAFLVDGTTKRKNTTNPFTISYNKHFTCTHNKLLVY